MPTDPEGDLDAMRRIAFVTLRFHELRGLMPAAFGLCLIFATFVEHITGNASRFSFAILQPLNFASCVGLLAIVALDRAYRHTFGDPVATSRQKLQAGLSYFVVMSGGLVDTVFPAALGGASVMAVGCATCALWIVVRDWPWRVHYLPMMVTGVAAAIMTAAAPATSLDPMTVNPSRMEVYLLAYTLIGLALVGGGLCDHRLLAAAMNVRPTEAEQQRPRTAGRFEMTTIAVLLAAIGALLLWFERPTATQVLPLLVCGLVIVFQVTVALPAAIRAIREFRRHSRVSVPTGPPIGVGGEMLAGLFAFALALSVESTFATRGVVALTLAAAIAWRSLRSRPLRAHSVMAAGVLVLSGALSRQAEPVQAFGLLLIGVSVTVTLHVLAPRPVGTTDAHTI